MDDNEPATVSVGARLRQLRETQGLSMRDLAEKLGDGTHFTTIGKIETGKVRLTAERIERIAEALGTTFAEIANPNFALSQMRPVAVVKPGPWMGSSDISSATKIGWVVSPRGGINSVAFYTIEFIQNVGRKVDGFTVVDTDDRELEDGGVYMLDTGEQNTLRLGVYRSEPPRFESYIGVGGQTILRVGVTPFTTIGRAVFEGRNL
ncbi:helix-turn-helix transcriptional regulator [Sphingomonas sp. HHU CXW]|uniref:Helix-turn-helix transcriptional regulator n=1 Tax=Sphingomonas hominis TaxID=2741495 RepID=A0ABX2JFF2_9SPHN|nr:helix-turn-helix transcriptional regulator [Sphingomonas hominis]